MDSKAVQRVKGAVVKVIRKYQYQSGAIDIPFDEAAKMFAEVKAAIAKAMENNS